MTRDRRELYDQIYTVSYITDDEVRRKEDQERMRAMVEQKTRVESELEQARSDLAQAVKVLSENPPTENSAESQRPSNVPQTPFPSTPAPETAGTPSVNGSGLVGFGGGHGLGMKMPGGGLGSGMGMGMIGLDGSNSMSPAAQNVVFQKHRVEYLAAQVQTFERDISYLVEYEKSGVETLKKIAETKEKIMRDPELRKLAELHRAENAASRARIKLWDSIVNSDPEGTKGAELECLADTKSCHGQLQKQSKIPEIDLRALSDVSALGETTTMFCTTSSRIGVGGSPDMYEPRDDGVGERPGNKCCARVKSNLGQRERRAQFLGYLGVEFIKQKIQNCFGGSTPELCLQRFNGMGCFGCTEKMGNNCYDGLVGADRPIYGARAADLMINTLMTDEEFGKIVADATNRIGRPVRSAFCAGKPAGQVKLDSASFFNLQKKYLMEGASGTYKTRIGKAIKVPENAAERAEYAKRETARAKTCSVHFKPVN